MMSPKKTGLAGVIVFAPALAVRLLFLWDSSSNPTFYTPILDAETCDTLAPSLAAGDPLTDKSLWQPLFYPFFLSIIYATLGGSIVCAKIVPAAIKTFENITEETGSPPRVWVGVEINQVVNMPDIQFIVSTFEAMAYAEIADLPQIGWHPADCP